MFFKKESFVCLLFCFTACFIMSISLCPVPVLQVDKLLASDLSSDIQWTDNDCRFIDWSDVLTISMINHVLLGLILVYRNDFLVAYLVVYETGNCIFKCKSNDIITEVT